MKKLFALLLVLVMVMGVFAGCAKKDDTTDPTKAPAGTNAPAGNNTEAPAGNTTEAPAGTTTVTPDVNIESWIIDEDKRDHAGQVRAYSAFKLTQGMQEMIDEFHTYYPNIEIVWGTFNNNSDGNMQINTMLANGEIDVLVSFGLNYTSARWKDGLFLDITDKIEEENIDLVANWGSDGYCLNDHYYSLPCGGLQYYVIINMTAWKEAGYTDLPKEWTWDEYVEASRKMTKKDADGNTVVYGGSSYSSINTILYCAAQVHGGDLYLNTDNYTSHYNHEITIKAFERELKCELEEKIWFPLATYRADGRKDYDTFLKGVCASTITCNAIRYVPDTNYDETRTFISGFAPFPTEEKGQTNYQSGVHQYSHVAVAAKCQDETAAWLFAKFYSTYGVKYLVKAGHQSNWAGTDTSEYLNIMFGSKENAEKYVDVESFLHVIGRTDLPNMVESTDEFNILTYSKHTGFLKDPLMKALAGEMTAKECLEQVAAEANAYLKSEMG
jgi:multiple sugar transport system substrate-binding protein